MDYGNDGNFFDNSYSLQDMGWPNICGKRRIYTGLCLIFSIFQRDSWELDTDAFFYDFEEISISSPSETCNEYLRCCSIFSRISYLSQNGGSRRTPAICRSAAVYASLSVDSRATCQRTGRGYGPGLLEAGRRHLPTGPRIGSVLPRLRG